MTDVPTTLGDGTVLAHVGPWTVGVTPHLIRDWAWVAKGRRETWPGLLFGGISLRPIRRKYRHRALRLFVEIARRIQAGEDPPPLPSTFLGLNRYLSHMEDA